MRPPLHFQEKVLGAAKDDYHGNDRENKECISNVCKIFHIWENQKGDDKQEWKANIVPTRKGKRTGREFL